MKHKKVGDDITTEIETKGSQKIKIKGKVKKVETHYGHKTYTVNEGLATDFKTRKIIK